MKLSHVLAGSAVIALLMSGTAIGTTFITSSTIADETITAADLGPDITRVKSVTMTIPSEEPTTAERCDGDVCGEYVDSATTTRTRTLRCPSGNVTGGGVRPLDDSDLWNLTTQSFPADDGAWTFKLYNDGPDDITVQLRIVCI